METQNKPSFIKSWKNIYLLVVAALVLQILFFTLITYLFR
jgi:hypothetical protein